MSDFSLRRLVALPLLAAGLVLPGLPRAAIEEPRVTFALREVGGGIGYEWGQGTLTYMGKSYPFRIAGGGIGSLGYVRVKADGHVADLGKITDFNGSYWQAGADAAVWRGAGYAAFENQKGVHLYVHMTMRGAHLGASIQKLSVTLLQAPASGSAPQ
ncbi:hypothetical protein [Acidomonas methanolica]|uniref:hypothetical protein n=1 Tax=Acidomonas methanolica TaxID=437 RepID=UPI002119D65C|nr:hypothetical protein [Acidomonas methanolica]